MIDPNEAPEGYRAEEMTTDICGVQMWCIGCDLRNTPECASAVCGKYGRADGCYVIFKRTGPVMATVPLNYGSMGEEVA